MVAPGTWQGAAVLLGGPDHTAVGVPVLITLLVVDRVVPRRWLPAAATLLLTFVLLVWAQLDDLVATLSCALPLAVVCGASVAAFLIAAGVRRLVGVVRRRRGRPAGPPRPARDDAQSPAYNAALAVLAAASFGVTELLIKAINARGRLLPARDPGRVADLALGDGPGADAGGRGEPADPVRRQLLAPAAAAGGLRLPAPGLRRRSRCSACSSPSPAGGGRTG